MAPTKKEPLKLACSCLRLFKRGDVEGLHSHVLRHVSESYSNSMSCVICNQALEEVNQIDEHVSLHVKEIMEVNPYAEDGYGLRKEMETLMAEADLIKVDRNCTVCNRNLGADVTLRKLYLHLVFDVHNPMKTCGICGRDLNHMDRAKPAFHIAFCHCPNEKIQFLLDRCPVICGQIKRIIQGDVSKIEERGNKCPLQVYKASPLKTTGQKVCTS